MDVQQKTLTDEQILGRLAEIRMASEPDIAIHFAYEAGWTGIDRNYATSAELIRPYINQSALRRSLARLVEQGAVRKGDASRAREVFGSTGYGSGRAKWYYWTAGAEEAALAEQRQQQAQEDHFRGLADEVGALTGARIEVRGGVAVLDEDALRAVLLRLKELL